MNSSSQALIEPVTQQPCVIVDFQQFRQRRIAAKAAKANKVQEIQQQPIWYPMPYWIVRTW